MSDSDGVSCAFLLMIRFVELLKNGLKEVQPVSYQYIVDTGMSRQTLFANGLQRQLVNKAGTVKGRELGPSW